MVVALAIVHRSSLIAAVMLSSFFSLLMAGSFVMLDAVDVAFAEAAVGAGITTVLLLGTLAVATAREVPVRVRLGPLALVVATAVLLIYGTSDLPAFGDPAAPAQRHVAPRYLELAEIETGVPNVVTAILASYRGYDTLGELTVILTAGVGVLLLLVPLPRRREEEPEDGEGR